MWYIQYQTDVKQFSYEGVIYNLRNQSLDFVICGRLLFIPSVNVIKTCPINTKSVNCNAEASALLLYYPAGASIMSKHRNVPSLMESSFCRVLHNNFHFICKNGSDVHPIEI